MQSLDNSIPLGESFPILVKLDNMPPNQEITLNIENAGIIPSLYKASVTPDSLGQAELRLTGTATRAQLNALNVSTFIGGSTVADLMLVNFEPPYGGELQASQVDKIVGEPITQEEYVSALPEANNLEELAMYESDPPPALLLNGISFLEQDGSVSEPVDLLDYNAGEQTGDGVVSTQASGCSSGNTYVLLRIRIDGSWVPIPESTKVTISGDAPAQTRYVGSSGKLCFDFSSGKNIYFRIHGWTSKGIYLHDSSNGYRLTTWTKALRAPYLGTLTASNILGDALVVVSSSTESIYRSLRVFYKINRVYNWERTVPNNSYSTFPLSVVYPDVSPYTTRAGYGRMFVDSGHYSSDPTLFHEFGHEVYYRRMLGGDTYKRHHEIAMNGGGTRFPWCAGSLSWSIWSSASGCAGMLEGFALWFESVSTRAIAGSERRPEKIFEPEDRPSVSGSNAGGAVPGRVAQYLWDITDAHAGSSSTVKDEDADDVKDYRSSIKDRYASVAKYFYSANDESDFNYILKYRILPKVSKDAHCKVVRYNTLSVAGTCG